MRLSNVATLTLLLHLFAPASGNELFCAATGIVGYIFAPSVKTIVYEQVQDQLNFNLPLGGGTLSANEPGEPEFDGCTFSLPLNMALDTPIMDIQDAATFTVTGTLQPTSLLNGLVCMQDVHVAEYGIESIPESSLIADALAALFGGSLPSVSVSEEACLSIWDSLRLGWDVMLSSLLGIDSEQERKPRMLRQRNKNV